MAGETSTEDKKDGEEPKTPKELVKDFCSYTTTHGVGRLAEARTLFSRSIWTIFILGAFAMFIFQTYGLFKLYLSRPVSTVVKVKHKTVCAFRLFKIDCIRLQLLFSFWQIGKDRIGRIYETFPRRLETYQSFMHLRKYKWNLT